MKAFLNNYFSFIGKFIPEKQSGSSVGLDIGVNFCKMIELTKKGNSYEILKWAIEPVTNGNVKEAVRKILTKTSVANKAPNTSMHGKGTLIRYIDLPKMTIEELRKSFYVEADKYFPFPKDQIYADCYILDSKNPDNKMSVLAAVAKKEIVDERIRLLTDLGLQTNFIGIDSIALCNILNVLDVSGVKKTSETEKPSATALLDIGEEVSNLTILKDNVPRFTRDIFIGGKELTKRISNALGVNFAEAEELKQNPKDKLQDILNACESPLMNLISEIRLSFDYFITEKNIPIERLLITGGGSAFSGIQEVFAKNLDINAEQWNFLKLLNLDPNISAEEINKSAPFLGIALGLALYQ